MKQVLGRYEEKNEGHLGISFVLSRKTAEGCSFSALKSGFLFNAVLSDYRPIK